MTSIPVRIRHQGPRLLPGPGARSADDAPATPATPAAGDRDRISAVLALVPAIAMVVIGSYRVGRRELWNDELVTWHAAALSVGELRRLVGNIDLVHLTYYAVIRVWSAVAGDSSTALRLPSTIAMAVTAGLIVLIGRRLSTITVGLVGATLFVLLPVVTRYAQEARSYAFVTAGATLATLLLLRAMERNLRRRWIWYGFSVVIMGWLHFVVLLVLLAHAGFVLLATKREDDRRWEWLIATGVAMLPVIPLLVWGSRQSGQISWVSGDSDAVARFPVDLFGGWQVAVAIVVLGLVGLGRALIEGRRTATVLLAVWALAPPVVGYLTYAWLHLFLARYFLFIMPAWCLLAAIAVCSAGHVFSRRRWPALTWLGPMLVIPLIAALGLPAQAKMREPTLPGQPAYFAAVRHVGAHAQAGDGVAFNDEFGRSIDLARTATNYGLRGGQRPRDVSMAKSAEQRGWLTATPCPEPDVCLDGTKRVWLIETGHLGRPFEGMPEPWAATFRDHFRTMEIRAFDRVRVILLERVDSPS